MTDWRAKESSIDDVPTGKFDVAFDATVQAPSTNGPIVLALPRGDAVPLELHVRFRDIERIGAGGMGVVYRAYDSRLGREVALKLLKDGDPTSWAGFLSEAQAQARVEHDNICRVHEVGDANGEPFIVMQFIRGKPLSQIRHEMNLRQRVESIQKIAVAVHAAHVCGLVHRDIKPGNILVERREDGGFRPYIVDFGIAREINPKPEHTLHGGIGTPAYMAPEMTAHKERRVVDLRVDVYALGATLYDVIAGRPPYVGQDAWDILEQRAKEDPPALRTVAKRAPPELEAIAMKCLERDPARRYASAEALADDLRRYLDGEPIAARRVGFVYNVRRMVRKHGRIVALIASVAAVVIAYGFMRRNASEQAELAQNIGQTVTEMELYMRTAYHMPPHDIERERAVVRERIKTLRRRVFEAGHENDPSAQYALGMAYIALGDEIQACEHLQHAETAGYTSPELGYTLPVAQLEAFAQLKSHSEWYTANEVQKQSEIAALESRYYAPALARLRTAEPARIEHPAYAAALVAYHEGRYAHAAQKAREGFERVPLLFEAKQLEADALFEIASQHWSSGKPDWWEQMSTAMATALDAYSAAENIARSNPRLLRSICGVRTRLMYAAFSARSAANPVHEYYDAARKACDRAVTVDPSSAEPHLARANMHSLYALTIARADGTKDPLAAIEEAVRVGKEALLLSPKNLFGYQALGNALRAQASVLLARGQNASAVLERAERHYDEARLTFKRDASLRDAVIFVDTLRNIDYRLRGIDILPRVTRSELLVDEAVAAKTLVTNALNKRAKLHIQLAEQQMERGASPIAEFDAAFGALIEAKESNPPNTIAWGKLRIFLGKARYALALGQSPGNSLQLAPEELKVLEVDEPDSALLAEMNGLYALTEAEERIRTGADPQTHLETARKAFRLAIERSPQNIEIAIGATRVELVATKFAISKNKATSALFDTIRKPLQVWTTDEVVHPDVYTLVAESYALQAEWNVGRHESPEADVMAGLAMVIRALATNPKHANAFATRGRLWLWRAKATTDTTARKNPTKNAVMAFDEAFRANPLLERTFGQARNEARQM